MRGWPRQAVILFQDYAAIYLTGMILTGDLGHVDLFKTCVSICTSLAILLFLLIIKVRRGPCRTGIERRDGQDTRQRDLCPPRLLLSLRLCESYLYKTKWLCSESRGDNRSVEKAL